MNHFRRTCDRPTAKIPTGCGKTSWPFLAFSVSKASRHGITYLEESRLLVLGTFPQQQALFFFPRHWSIHAPSISSMADPAARFSASPWCLTARRGLWTQILRRRREIGIEGERSGIDDALASPPDNSMNVGPSLWGFGLAEFADPTCFWLGFSLGPFCICKTCG